jgi:hypothetical protein
MNPIRISAAVVSALAIAMSAFLQPATSIAADPLPDLVVNSDVLQHQWVVRDEFLPSTFCSVQEGGITPGVHTLLRFSVQTPNIGNADIDLGDPNVHVAHGDGLYEFATCHNHYHFRHYTFYELIDPATGKVWKAAKRGFCMIDTNPAPPSVGGNPPGPRVYKVCGRVGIPGNQGISVGWADEYIFLLGGQYFVLDGGDGQPAVPPGRYKIRITVNPPFVALNGEPCPHKDPAGFCHQLLESNYFNNVGEAFVQIADHPGRGGLGPLAGTPHPSDKGNATEPIDGD